MSLTWWCRDLPDMLPAGAVSGDFHVHGAASYDSSIPDQDRVVSFLAAGVDVIVATDHDVVTSYASTLAALGAAERRWSSSPASSRRPTSSGSTSRAQDFPKTLGHFNFWPLAPDFALPRNGAPWDELREPGQMMDDMEAAVHRRCRARRPPAQSSLPRRQAGARPGLPAPPSDTTRPRPSPQARASPPTCCCAAPGGGRRNIDWDVQEVMTGASRRDWLRYRALWFSLLSQGILRAGAANSDTHAPRRRADRLPAQPGPRRPPLGSPAGGLRRRAPSTTTSGKGTCSAPTGPSWTSRSPVPPVKCREPASIRSVRCPSRRLPP